MEGSMVGNASREGQIFRDLWRHSTEFKQYRGSNGEPQKDLEQSSQMIKVGVLERQL